MAPKASLEATEAKFADQAGIFYAKLVDLNVSMSTIAGVVTGILKLRHQLLTQYGIPEDPKWNPQAAAAAASCTAAMSASLGVKAPKATGGQGAKGGNGRAAGNETSRDGAKSQLNVAFSKIHKRGSKEYLVYTTSPDGNGSFLCCLTSPQFSNEYWSPALGNKKGAEEAAAQLALKAEFPGTAVPTRAAAPPRGQKRKAEPSDGDNTGKRLVLHQMQLMLGRSCTAGDIVYEGTELSRGQYQCSLSFPSYDGSASFTGTGSSKKEAEATAANSAAQVFAPMVAPLEEASKAKKVQKMQEKKAAKKAALG